MDKKMEYRLLAAGMVCLIVWSLAEILNRIEPVQSQQAAGYHWDIIGLEVLLICGCYALLLIKGLGSMKTHLQESR